MSDKLRSEIKKHYGKRVEEFGDSYAGVNYSEPEIQQINFRTILEVIRDPEKRHSLLDVGCGLGHLLDYITDKKLQIEYSGIDITDEMVAKASERHPEGNFRCCTISETDPARKFDFVTAIGVFTRKTVAPTIEEMEALVYSTIPEMFSRAECGIAFNMVTSYVEYTKEELHYFNPGKVLDFCRTELTRHVTIRHDYPLWDFSVYAYKPDYIKSVYGYYR